MVKIRLARGGSLKRPFYHIVVADSRQKRDGRYIERLGFFSPMASGQQETFRLDNEKVERWVANGAQMTDRVRSLIKQNEKAAA